ncbi:acyl-CoA N-acyltransferase [Xylariomycetidae sp. FL2044]|nr:acyl-CoA N-acyltransferase [Xylariomycetidae sp. FL2044]
MAMKAMTTALAGAFRSERLIYRAVEDNDADKALMYEMNQDPVLFGLAAVHILKPMNRQLSDKAVFDEVMKESILAVAICLPPATKGKDEAEEKAEAEAEAEAEDPKSKKKREGGGDDSSSNSKNKNKKKPREIGFLFLSDNGTRALAWHRRTELGIMIAGPHQNRGYGTEAINWAVDWAFRWAGVHSVAIGTLAYNDRAAALYQKLGFRLEGRSREVVYMNRRWWDLLSLGMLESEWEALRGAKK